MTRRHFPLFDSLRGIAVLSVIAFHVASLTGRLGEGPSGRLFTVLGGQAVIVFFAISGFLLYRPYLTARARGRGVPSARTFLHRRAFRILPGYWVILTALAIFPGLALVWGDEWWRYYGFLQLYDPDTVLRGLPVAWTLCVEVTFYLMLPLWALGVRRLPQAAGDEGWVRPELLALALATAGGVALQLLVARHVIGRTLGDTLFGQLPWLALGMALAVGSVVATERARGGRAAPRWTELAASHSGAVWAAGGAALLGLMALVPAGGLRGLLAAVATERPFAEAVAHIVLSAVLAVAFLLPAVHGDDRGGLPRRILRLAPVAWVGTISYSIYLWHLPVAQFIAVRDDPYHFSATGLGLLDHVEAGSTPVLYVATVAVSAVLSALTYYGVERPFIERSHRGTPTKGVPQAASGA